MDLSQRHRAMLLSVLDDRRFDPNEPRLPHGPGGGRWGSLGGIVGKIKHWHNDSSGVHDLAAAVESGETSRTKLSGGRMGTTELVVHRNGAKTVSKTFLDVSAQMGPGYEPESQADAEQLSAVAGTKIGAPVARVLRTAPDAITTEFIEGESAVEIRNKIRKEAKTVREELDVPETAHAEIARIAATPAGVRLGAFDILTGQWDRSNPANWMLTPAGAPVGIDHAFGFDDQAAFPSEPPARGLVGPFATQFVDYTSAPPRWANNPLSQNDIAWLRKQLGEIEDDFTARKSHDWWEFMLERLDAIAPYASGTESKFAPR
ncbi:MAG: hypothetical protein V4515_14870 [Chloroflexota bacterium]